MVSQNSTSIRSGHYPVARLQEFLKNRSLLWLLIRRDLQSRYAGSTLGVLWNIIHPIILVGVYVLIFSSIMADRVGGGSTLTYAVHLTAGMIPWLVFSEIVSRSSTLLAENANFLQKVAIPVEILHISLFLSTLLLHSISYIALAAFLVLVGYDLPIRWMWVFPLVVLFAMVATGIGLILSVLHLVLKDVGQLVNVALQFLFWLSPIVYPMTALPESIQTILRYNPLLPYVSLSQFAFGDANSAQQYLMSAHGLFLLPFLTLSAGILFLRKHRGELLDLL